ncbi:MAG: sigma-70 family RNA polymerase sigma factor [Sedimentisphaerales bacterium]|nr:sigma-70 family RNA polymerase sigma factor [Sedimentisphaerales bacterium]MBN2842668.1 sigma-70 family RNA polymerase sigma factor [Sedimentisphaerales bacterium]
MVDSTLQVYLEEINQTGLLNAEEEKVLAERIMMGDHEARDLMIRSNLRLVVNIAKKYVKAGMLLADLIEEGNLGLMRAVEGFDPAHGVRFSTYASWWIKQAIKRSLVNSTQPIHVPAYMVEMITRWKHCWVTLIDELGRTPSLSEMSEAMQVSPRKLNIIRKAVEASASGAQMPANDESNAINDMLEDIKTPRPDEPMQNADDAENIRGILDMMDQREATILKMRYGLDGSEPMTLKDIGEEIGLTRERVRQIEKEALTKLHSTLILQD